MMTSANSICRKQANLRAKKVTTLTRHDDPSVVLQDDHVTLQDSGYFRNFPILKMSQFDKSDFFLVKV